MIARDVLASKLRDYIQHHISRAKLVDSAEDAMMEAVVLQVRVGRPSDPERSISSRAG